MLSKFSINKPMTVIVAVIIVLILGTVAYLNTSVDLLPDIELPYVVVMTAYIGATPEKVESEVTKPLEAAVASVSGIEDIYSLSAENSSIMILQFGQNVNMDSAMLELNNYINAVSAAFDEEVGAPFMLRLNPSMMPVMVMTADHDGMGEAEFSDYVERELVPALERIEGVSSVTAMGLLEQRIEVVWDDAAIAGLNDRILLALDAELLESRAELDEARRELDDAQAEIDEESQKAYDEIADAAAELADGRLQIQLGLNALETAPDELDAAKSELESTRESLAGMLELYDGIDQIDDGLSQMSVALRAMNAVEDEISAEYGSVRRAIAALNAAQTALQERYAVYESDPADTDSLIALQSAGAAAAAALERALPLMAMIAAMDSSVPFDAAQTAAAIGGAPAMINSGAPASVAQGYAMLDGLLDGFIEGFTGFSDARNTLEAQYAALQNQKNQLEAAAMMAGDMSASEINEAIEKVDEGLDEIDEAIAELPEAEQELHDAQAEIDDGSRELEKGRLELTTELASAQAQLAIAEQQLDDAYEQFDEAREQAFKDAGLDGVLTPSLVAGILAAGHFSMPAGYIAGGDGDYTVKVGEQFSSLEELRGLMLMNVDMDGVGPIYLSDIAEVAMADNAGEYYARINGNPGIILTLAKQSAYGTSEVSESINAVMEQLMSEQPELHLAALSDQGYYIRVAVDSVLSNLLLGAALAMLILILFLRSLRPTLIIAVSIPISLLFALALMYFSGVTINVISLAGLAAGVGMLVDNSIIVIENIFRLRREGLAAHTAALRGARQMSGAIIASTLTTICVFVPILFTHGISRQLFTDMGLTVAYSLLASLLVALSLVPMLASTTLKDEHQPKQRPVYQKMLDAYARALDFCLRRKAPLLLAVAAVAVFAGVSVYSLGTVFMPEVDYWELTMTVDAKDEQASAEEVQALTDQVVERVLTIDGVRTVGAFENDQLTQLAGGESGIAVYVLMDYEQDTGAFAAARLIRERVADIEDAVVEINTTTMDMSALSGSGIEIALTGNDGDSLRQAAGEVAALLAEVEGTADINDGMDASAPELRVIVDKNKAMAEGVTVAQVYGFLAADLNRETSSISVDIDGREYSVILAPDPNSELTEQKLYEYSFEVDKTDSSGKTETSEVYLSDIAEIEQASALTTIARVNQVRGHSVTAAVADGYNIGLLAREVQQRLDQYQPPAGVSVRLQGENEMIVDTMKDLLLMILLAIVFIYLIMVAQFQNLLLPFIVLLTIPLAFTGGLLALIVCGMEVSVVAMLGFLILAGVIVNNGIVFVDCVNQLRRDEGLEKREALLRAGQMRMRPIMMTALTTIFGLAAMALAQQMGAELLQPLALVAIGGLLYATLLTLFLVPVMYDILQRRPVPRRLADEEA
ncbi:MAG: efflux RND transporter permease subunit [Bacillota bacterium]|nr:efflux RND transporter permease subunit [Bacillota bacterium]